jgi:hypothetical protein
MREVFWAGVSTLTEEIQTVQRDGLKMKVVMALLGALGTAYTVGRILWMATSRGRRGAPYPVDR